MLKKPDMRIINPIGRPKPVIELKCNNCGKCCDFGKSGHRPYITATDVRVWLDKGLWHIIKQIEFIIAKGEGSVERQQEWSFRAVKGVCVFRINGKCAIYSVRPLACAVYPVVGTCRNHLETKCTNKHLIRQFQKAHKEWRRATNEWKQDKLKELIAACEKRGLIVKRDIVESIDDKKPETTQVVEKRLE